VGRGSPAVAEGASIPTTIRSIAVAAGSPARGQPRTAAGPARRRNALGTRRLAPLAHAAARAAAIRASSAASSNRAPGRSSASRRAAPNRAARPGAPSA
jgi:hypothetical protein